MLDKNHHLGILGAGKVGVHLANRLAEKGYKVSVGSRRGIPVEGWDGEVGTFENIAERADAFLLAVKGTAAEEVISRIKDLLEDKIVMDATNPLSNNPTDEGVLDYFTTFQESLMERLQAIAPKARFVKAFNSVGHQLMIDPELSDTPTMFICGNDADAKSVVSNFLQANGWEAADFGGVRSARAIEPLCLLWCIPAFANNEWNHAFKYLTK